MDKKREGRKEGREGGIRERGKGKAGRHFLNTIQTNKRRRNDESYKSPFGRPQSKNIYQARSRSGY